MNSKLSIVVELFHLQHSGTGRLPPRAAPWLLIQFGHGITPASVNRATGCVRNDGRSDVAMPHHGDMTGLILPELSLWSSVGLEEPLAVHQSCLVDGIPPQAAGEAQVSDLGVDGGVEEGVWRFEVPSGDQHA